MGLLDASSPYWTIMQAIVGNEGPAAKCIVEQLEAGGWPTVKGAPEPFLTLQCRLRGFRSSHTLHPSLCGPPRRGRTIPRTNLLHQTNNKPELTTTRSNAGSLLFPY